MGQFNSHYDQMRAEQKSKAMASYKSELDRQLQNKQVMRGYGNMTNVEKEMNKDDLNAWKKYDDNQYSMIPGITAAKRFAEPKPAKFSSPPNRSGKAALHNEDKVRIHEERLV